MRQLLEGLGEGFQEFRFQLGSCSSSCSSSSSGSGSRGSGSERSGSVREEGAGEAASRPGSPGAQGARASAAATGIVRGRRRGRLRLENLRPVELDIRIVLFDPADGVFVERGAADLDVGRRAKPVKKALLSPPVVAAGVNERGGFVPAFVAGEPQDGKAICVWMSAVSLAGLRGRRLLAAFARRLALTLPPWPSGALGAGACRTSAGALYTGMNRIWSPTSGSSESRRPPRCCRCRDAWRHRPSPPGHTNGRRPKPSERHPLRHGFEVIDGLGGFDLDHGVHTPPPVW